MRGQAFAATKAPLWGRGSLVAGVGWLGDRGRGGGKLRPPPMRNAAQGCLHLGQQSGVRVLGFDGQHSDDHSRPCPYSPNSNLHTPTHKVQISAQDGETPAQGFRHTYIYIYIYICAFRIGVNGSLGGDWPGERVSTETSLERKMARRPTLAKTAITHLVIGPDDPAPTRRRPLP